MNDKLQTEYNASRFRNKPWKAILFVILITTIAMALVPNNEIDDANVLSIPSPNIENNLSQSRVAVLPKSSDEIELKKIEKISDKDDLSKNIKKNNSVVLLKNEKKSPPGMEARVLIKKYRLIKDPKRFKIGLNNAYAKAKIFEKEGQNDDAYLLYFFAAKKGHGEASMELGRRADPAYFVRNGLFLNANLSQAFRWYKNAKKAGSNEADQFLSALYVRVTNRANSGDEEARRALLQWDIEIK